MTPRKGAGDPAPPGDRPESVGELSRRIARLLEGEIGDVAVSGEVSGVRIPASGHCYFMLKDAEAAINAVCFRSALGRSRVVPANGMQLELRGRISAYSPRSEYQIIVETMREAGLGELMRRFMELKEKLKAEGIFDAERKRPIPQLPRRIGLVTSSTGAALRDMLNVLARRGRGLEIYLSPAAVQGEAAPAEIVRALERLQRHHRVEVIIAGRGGGSIEDLWAFNDERVARAIAACSVPVISAVGHETDTTLADYAADLRAPTPSAAAELVSAHYGELADRHAALQRRLARAGRDAIESRRLRVERCGASWGLRSPVERLGQAMQRADDLRERLERGWRAGFERRGRDLAQSGARLRQAAPMRRLALARERLARVRGLLAAVGPVRWTHRLESERSLLGQILRRLSAAADSGQRARRAGLRALGEKLQAVSPEAVLKRGYSIVQRGAKDRVVTAPEQVRIGEVVRIRSAGGTWRAAALPAGDDLFDAVE